MLLCIRTRRKYTSIVEQAQQFGSNVKKARKATRKPKAMSSEKILKNFKYLKTDPTLRLVSVSPESVLGADELWAYNTANRVLTVIRALDRGGLGVKNTKIIGFNADTSMAKRLRKPEEALAKLMGAGKVTLRSFMDELKTKPAYFTERINPNTLLLRTIRS